jgi:hypothetical protein
MKFIELKEIVIWFYTFTCRTIFLRALSCAFPRAAWLVWVGTGKFIRKGRDPMKLTSKLAVAALAGALLSGAAAQAQEMIFFRIGTGSAGGTYFPIGGLIANAISNPPGSRPCDEGGNCGVRKSRSSGSSPTYYRRTCTWCCRRTRS